MKKNVGILIVFVLGILLPATISNVGVGNMIKPLTMMRSILDQPHMDSDNISVKAHEAAREADVRLSNDVGFQVRLNEINVTSLQFLIDFIESVEVQYEEAGIVVDVGSLATQKDYGAEQIDYFLSEKMIYRENFNAEDWLEYIQSKIYLNNFFVADTDGGAVNFYFLLLPRDQDVNEIDLFYVAHKIKFGWNLASLNMYFGDAMNWLGLAPENLVDFPKGVKVDTYGWSIWRTLISKTSFSFIFSILIVGSILPIIAVWFALRSLRQVVICLVSNLLILWTMRGMIGVINLVVPWTFHEETYTILAYVPVMILNYSFFLRSFKTFNAISPSNLSSPSDYIVTWGNVLRDRSLRVSVWFVSFVAAVDFIIFMCLPHVSGSRPLLNVGILTSVTIVLIVLPFTRLALPALHSIFGGIGRRPSALEDTRWARAVISFATWKHSYLVSAGVILILIGGVTAGYMKSMLNTESNPGAFIKAIKEAGPTMIEMEKIGQPGSGMYKIFARGGDLLDPTYVQSISDYTDAVRDQKIARGFLSPTDLLSEVLSRDFPDMYSSKERLLSSKIEEMAHSVDMSAKELLEAEWGILAEDPVNKNLFALSDSSVLFFATNLASKTSEMIYYCNKLSEVGANIGAIVASRLHQYAESDKAITSGALQNYIGSPVLIAVVSMMLFALAYAKHSVYSLSFIRAGLLTAIPFVFSTSLTLLSMMTLRIPMDVATAAIGNITVSAAADLSFFMIVRLQEKKLAEKITSRQALSSNEMADEISRASYDVGVNGLTYVPLTISLLTIFPPIRDLGLMLIVALIGCYLGTLLMLPFTWWRTESV